MKMPRLIEYFTSVLIIEFVLPVHDVNFCIKSLGYEINATSPFEWGPMFVQDNA